jgi:uncharacterized membrane protein YhhN
MAPARMPQPSDIAGAIMMMVLYISVFAVPGVRDSLFVGVVEDKDTPVVLFGTAIFKAIPVLALARMVSELPVPEGGSGSGSGLGSYTRSIALGLALSSLGDFCLDLDHVYPLLFLAGLGSFLTAHVLYALAFASRKPSHSVLAGILVASFPGGMFYLLWPHLQKPEAEPLLLPVVVYMLAIGTMVYLSIVRTEAAAGSSKGKYLSALGAVVFAVSDSILAWDKFASPVPFAKVLVMVTYYGAQLLIAFGTRASVLATAEGKKAVKDAQGKAQ